MKFGRPAWVRTTDYGVIVLDSDEVPIGRPCEDCGGLMVSGLEPFAPGDDPELEAEGLTAAGKALRTPMSVVRAHQATH